VGTIGGSIIMGCMHFPLARRGVGGLGGDVCVGHFTGHLGCRSFFSTP